MFAHLQRLARLTFAKYRENEEAVDSDEAAVMNNEKWNHKKLTEMKYRMLDFGESNFEDVVKADNEVFRPVKQDDVECIPAEDDHAVYGRHIGQYQDQQWDISPATARRL